MNIRHHFITRTIAHDPWASFLDGLAFLGLIRVNIRELKDNYAFVDDRLRLEFANIRRDFRENYKVTLRNISGIRREKMNVSRCYEENKEHECMDDYWIFFHELSCQIAQRIPRNTGRYFIFSTVYHALVHGMYNAVIHGDHSSDIRLKVNISPATVTLEMTSKIKERDDKKMAMQYYTRFGIHVGGGGNAKGTLAQLFDAAELRFEEQGGGGQARLILRHDLKRRPWPARLKRAFLGRAIGVRDTRQLYYMYGSITGGN